jgi:hypothetical protein
MYLSPKDFYGRHPILGGTAQPILKILLDFVIIAQNMLGYLPLNHAIIIP